MDVPEWGGKVRVQALTTGERGKYETGFYHANGKPNFEKGARMRSVLVSQTVVDDKGFLLFTEDDVAALEAQEASAVSRIFEVAQRLAGITKADMDELEAISKNSDTTTNA